MTACATERQPTVAEQCGMTWWNRLSPRERGEWLRRAGSAVPADAWAAFRGGQQEAATALQ